MRLHLWERSELAPAPLEVPVAESPAGWTWQNQQPLIVPDLTSDPRFPPVLNILREKGLGSYCWFPLTTAQRRLGTLGLGSSQANAYTERDMRLLPRVAKLVAVAVENALTREALAREKERLRMLLEVLGHHVRIARDGMAGLDLARANIPDVMLVDIGLPSIDGYEVARLARGPLRPDRRATRSSCWRTATTRAPVQERTTTRVAPRRWSSSRAATHGRPPRPLPACAPRTRSSFSPRTPVPSAGSEPFDSPSVHPSTSSRRSTWRRSAGGDPRAS